MAAPSAIVPLDELLNCVLCSSFGDELIDSLVVCGAATATSVMHRHVHFEVICRCLVAVSNQFVLLRQLKLIAVRLLAFQGRQKGAQMALARKRAVHKLHLLVRW